eukprot:CAMPEP_0172443076 /NCGR_PEP_ID=MMETSP1065-20121228/3387_1 /TAXON_ID=265537 /ORGANISM="Amphiprora paludosa, Strain CCMP125" /LENGTH=244 /DNA_ID=CAMNT_0013193169 /DNA_START=186 /DNA_END=920 /DNA_ORIENTATION=+
MSNQNNNNVNDLTNLINLASQSQNTGENDFFQQATLLQQLLQSQQQQQQQQPPQQQQGNNSSLSQQQQPQQNYQPQQLQQQNSATPVPYQQQEQSNMQFGSGFSMNAFETLVAPPPASLMPQAQSLQQPQQQQQLPRPPFSNRSNLNEREQFVVFIKILMKLTNNNPGVKSRAKAIISECTRRNRMGDLEYSPLQEAVERRLKHGVGELYMARAKLFFNAYCERNGIRSTSSTMAMAQVPVASI